MAKRDYLFTSESVSEGHPDKVCDRISDAVVDTFLAADPQARVACETLATTNRVVMAGEVRGPASITEDLLVEVARSAIRDIGYEQEGFRIGRRPRWSTCCTRSPPILPKASMRRGTRTKARGTKA